MERDDQLPTWARRVAKSKVRRLYETDARGIYDEELIDEVGYGLLARCESFITASRAVAGELPCPRCGARVRREEVLRCPCGWELPWADYFRTMQHKQLSGAEPVLDQFRSFVEAFPSARTPRERMLRIDRLLHGFHWYLKANAATSAPTRPVAVNLLEGRLGDVVAFLEGLTYGRKSTPGTTENLADWNSNIEVNRSWYPSRREPTPPPSPAPDTDAPGG